MSRSKSLPASPYACTSNRPTSPCLGLPTYLLSPLIYRTPHWIYLSSMTITFTEPRSDEHDSGGRIRRHRFLGRIDRTPGPVSCSRPSLGSANRGKDYDDGPGAIGNG